MSAAIPAKPANCTCQFPDLIARNMCGHGEDPQGRDCPVLVQFHLDLEESRRQAAWEDELARHLCPQCKKRDARFRTGGAENCTNYECGRCDIEYAVFDRDFYEEVGLPLPAMTVRPSSRPMCERVARMT